MACNGAAAAAAFSSLYAVAALTINGILMDNVSLSSSQLSLPPVATIKTFNFENGSVQLQDPWTIRRLTPSHRDAAVKLSTSTMTLKNPKLLGYGGGGAIFSYELHDDDDPNLSRSSYDVNNNDNDKEFVAVKVSWSLSAASVRNECYVLQTLQHRLASLSSSPDVVNALGIERCLAQIEYGPEPNRSVIFVQPVMPTTSISSVSDLRSVSSQKIAVRTIIRTALQMLSAGVVTTDVQPLIDPDTGQTVLIDLTEAKILSPSQPSGSTVTTTSSTTTSSSSSSRRRSSLVDQQDMALVNAFVTEVSVLIPDEYYEFASKVFIDELTRIQKEGHLSIASSRNSLDNVDRSGHGNRIVSLFVDPDVQQILKNLPFANDDMIQLLEALDDERS